MDSLSVGTSEPARDGSAELTTDGVSVDDAAGAPKPKPKPGPLLVFDAGSAGETPLPPKRLEEDAGVEAEISLPGGVVAVTLTDGASLSGVPNLIGVPVFHVLSV